MVLEITNKQKPQDSKNRGINLYKVGQGTKHLFWYDRILDMFPLKIYELGFLWLLFYITYIHP